MGTVFFLGLMEISLYVLRRKNRLHICMFVLQNAVSRAEIAMPCLLVLIEIHLEWRLISIKFSFFIFT